MVCCHEKPFFFQVVRNFVEEAHHVVEVLKGTRFFFKNILYKNILDEIFFLDEIVFRKPERRKTTGRGIIIVETRELANTIA